MNSRVAAYWNKDYINQGVSSGSSGYPGLTTSEMKGDVAKKNMSNLDFTTSDNDPAVWATQSSGYPIFKYQVESK